jgi:hypothetical protein
MRVAGRFVLTAIVTLLIAQSISGTVQPSDRDNEGQIDYVAVLCGTISQDTETLWEFYVTCSVTVSAGVNLNMGGMGYVSPWASITVYGNLDLSAYLTWNATSPPADPDAWRWGGINVYSPGSIQASGFSIEHTAAGGLVIASSNNYVRSGIFSDNVFTSMHDGYALQVSSNDNIIDGIRITNTASGLDLSDGTGNIIRDSYFSGLNSGIKLGEMGAAYGNTIICNDFVDINTSIIGRSVFPGSGNNLIHHNNFLGYGMAYAEAVEIWDDGYPNGGNYWASHVSNDTFRGPNQDIPGSDGIADDQFAIYDLSLNKNFDRYPFFNQVPSSGCPSPPPQMPNEPLPPYGISADLEGLSLSDVRISWSLSPDDGLPGFQNYAIYYSQTFRKDRTGYGFLTEVSAGASTFIHSGAGHGDPSSYFYYVQANDTSGKPGIADEQVAKYVRGLTKGMNLVSIPLSLADTRLETLLQMTPVERALAFNASAQEWEEFNTLKSHGDLEHLDITQGLWLDASQSGYLTVAGGIPDSVETYLGPGWNLVAYASLVSQDVASSLLGIPYERIEGFDASQGPYFLKQLNAGDLLTPSNAYWIKVSTSCTWTVAN